MEGTNMCDSLWLRTWLVEFTFRTRETRKIMRGEARYLAVTGREAARCFDQEWSWIDPHVIHIGVEELQPA